MHLWLVAHDAYNNNKINEKNGGVANMQLIMHHFLLGGCVLTENGISKIRFLP